MAPPGHSLSSNTCHLPEQSVLTVITFAEIIQYNYTVDHTHPTFFMLYNHFICTILPHPYASNNAPKRPPSPRLRLPLPLLVVAPLHHHRGWPQEPPPGAARLAHRGEPLPSHPAAPSLHLRHPRLT